ncbi:MAG TPA: hypothetical protein VFU05_02320 [Cyclobacteriaceae bacterium]|nr:hypothetical protein [Cyclobacteriaceae bacterium]
MLKRLHYFFAMIIVTQLFSSCGNDDPSSSGGSWGAKADCPFYGSFAFVIGTKAYVKAGKLWEYDYTNDAWTDKGNAPLSQATGYFAFVIDGKAYLGVGDYASYYTREVWEYDPQLNKWTQKKDFPGTARGGVAGFAINGKGYFTGGDDSTPTPDNTPNGNLAEVWEYNPTLDEWIQKKDFPGGGRNGAVSFVIGNKGYIGTGYYVSKTNGLGSGNNLQDFWEYDPTTDTWVRKSDLPGESRSDATGFSIGNKGYIGTGFGISGYSGLNDWWEYDVAKNKWSQKKDFVNQGWDYFAFSIGQKGYLGGGGSTDLFEFKP